MDVASIIAFLTSGLALAAGAGWWRSRVSTRRSQARLASTETEALTGVWTEDRRRNANSWSPGVFRILGLDPAQDRPRPIDRCGLIVPGQGGGLAREIAELSPDRPRRQCVARLHRPDGLRDIAVT